MGVVAQGMCLSCYLCQLSHFTVNRTTKVHPVNAMTYENEITYKAIKTHKWHTFKKCAYEGAIIIVRNPFHALIAEFNRQEKFKSLNFS